MYQFSLFRSIKLWRVFTVLALGLAALMPASAPVVVGASIDLIGPEFSGEFGKSVTVLPNGNLVVTDPKYSPTGAANAGAVYLYDGVTHAIISTLTGSQADDEIGSDGVTILNDGSFVVKSIYWANGTSTSAGALTWCSATAGCSGEVTSANSLVGSHTDDKVGYYGVSKLDGSAFLVKSPGWNSGAGALTYCADGPTCNGIVADSNSLVGSTNGDSVGALVIVLPGEGYVTYAPNWDRGGIVNAGAVTGCSMAGCTGFVSTDNSLHGSTATDSVGSSVTALIGGGYVVSNLHWINPGVGDVGAATYCSERTTRRGHLLSRFRRYERLHQPGCVHRQQPDRDKQRGFRWGRPEGPGRRRVRR